MTTEIAGQGLMTMPAQQLVSDETRVIKQIFRLLDECLFCMALSVISVFLIEVLSVCHSPILR